MITALFVNGTFNVIHGGKSYNAGPDHPNYKGLIDAFNKQDGDLFVKLCDVPRSIVVQSGGKVVVDGDKVLYNGREIHNTLVDRMLEMFNQGLNISSLIKFLENLMLNPSNASVNELYDFIERNRVPITSNGTFIAYKVVDKDYMDKYTHTIKNAVGTTVKFERNQVDDNRKNNCSYGLHVGASQYSFFGGTYYRTGDHVLLVEVNPKHVVSVPTDYNCSKMRVEEYKILEEVKSTDKPIEDLVYNTWAVDTVYDFDYLGEKRRATIIKVFDTYLHCRCLKGDPSAGQFRNFSLDSIQNPVEVW